MNITVFSEYGTAFRGSSEVGAMHPHGLHETLKELFSAAGKVTAIWQEDGDGCARFTDEVLSGTDLLVWWGHCLHHEVPDALAEKIAARVQGGMGAIFCIRRTCPNLSAG